MDSSNDHNVVLEKCRILPSWGSGFGNEAVSSVSKIMSSKCTKMVALCSLICLECVVPRNLDVVCFRSDPAKTPMSAYPSPPFQPKGIGMHPFFGLLAIMRVFRFGLFLGHVFTMR